MSRLRRSSDTRQTNLLEAIRLAEELAASAPQPGVNSQLELGVGRAMAAYFRRPEALTRWDVAGKISEDLDREVSKAMLDKFTAETAPHHLPADVVASFVKVTGFREPLDALCRAAGVVCLPGADMIRAEIQRTAESERTIRAQKKRLLAYLEAMEETP